MHHGVGGEALGDPVAAQITHILRQVNEAQIGIDVSDLAVQPNGEHTVLFIQHAVSLAGGGSAHLIGLGRVGVSLQLGGGPNGGEDGGFLGGNVLLLGDGGIFAVRQGLTAHSQHPVGILPEYGQMGRGVGQVFIQLHLAEGGPVLGRGGLSLNLKVVALGLHPAELKLVVAHIFALQLQIPAQQIFPDDLCGKITVAVLHQVALLAIGEEGECILVTSCGQGKLFPRTKGEDLFVFRKGAERLNHEFCLRRQNIVVLI